MGVPAIRKQAFKPAARKQYRGIIGQETLAGAASLDTSSQVYPLKLCAQPTKQSQKLALRANPKRASVDENNKSEAGNACVQHKRRVVLQDVTNAFCKPSYGDCFNATEVQFVFQWQC
ncbi:hypothetical protein ABKV19_021380 [Rosa sericea]